MKVIGIIGASALNKAPFVEMLIASFRFEGWSVSTIKRAPDGFDMDRPGKTSWARREAGCHEVMLVGDRRLVLMQEFRADPAPALGTLLARLEPVDLVIVEGFQSAAVPTIEICVAASGRAAALAAEPARGGARRRRTDRRAAAAICRCRHCRPHRLRRGAPRAVAARVTPPATAAGRDADPWRLVPALGIAQIISWGALYYAIAVLGASIGADLGLSPAHVFGAYSAGLLLSGLTAPVAGRAIDRWSGRIVLTMGSVVAALALFFLSRASSALEYYLAWCVGGVAMGLTLYDPAFATLSQHFGTSYRKALTALTLFGGFASTVFWPLAQLGLVHLGWRDTLAAFAALELVVCLPLHWWLIPARGRSGHGARAPTNATARSRPPPAQHVAAVRRAGIVVRAECIRLFGDVRAPDRDDARRRHDGGRRGVDRRADRADAGRRADRGNHRSAAICARRPSASSPSAC